MSKNNRAKKKTANKPARKIPTHVVEKASLDALTDHPRNYQEHPEEQLAHIRESIRTHGIYKNVVTAWDYTILAGHGVVKAARLEEMKEISIIRLKLKPDDPLALKLVAGDNEISNLAEINDRSLSELLKEIKESGSLLGTGFDDKALAALLMVTRPESEIADFDAAAHWVGMPEFGTGNLSFILSIQFQTMKERDNFVKKSGISPDDCMLGAKGRIWSTWLPPRKRDDRDSIKFEQSKKGEPEK